MNLIVFLSPFISHFISLMDFADKMMKNGHRVIFVGYQETRKLANEYKYEYILIKSCDKEPGVKDREKRLAQKEELQQILSIHKAGMVLFPVSRFPMYFEVVCELDLPILLYSLCCGADRINLYCPPNTSGYLPQKYGNRNMISLLHWLRRFMRLEFHHLVKKNKSRWHNCVYDSKKYGKKLLYGLDGYYLDYPKLLLGPGKFNLYKNESIFFWGLGVSEKRESGHCLYKVNGKKNIYCTFGTLSSRYSKMISFLNVLVCVLEKRSDWHMLLQMDEKHAKCIRPCKNITVVLSVDQLDIIRDFDAVICHGGFGTIKECIYYGTPIFVVPCSYDQHGNAARVTYFQIGIKSDVLVKSMIDRILKRKTVRCSADDIEKLLDELLYNAKYAENIAALRRQILTEKEEIVVIDYVNRMTSNE